MLVSGFLFTSCQESTKNETADPRNSNQITREEVITAQQNWRNAIVRIGESYSSGGDYVSLASQVVDSLYGYDEGVVLFAPTKASELQFRLKKEEALSYFVGGIIPEDKGFALNPWSNVRFENAGMILNDNQALVMGNYWFTDAKTGEDVKVAYTFCFFKDANGKLRINVHHSSLPYKQAH